MSHVKPQYDAAERSSTVLYARENVEREDGSRTKSASASRTKEFHKLRLAANDAVRRFQGISITENGNQNLITMTPYERLVIQEVFQCVRPSTGLAFATKAYLRAAIGCDAKVVASSLAKAIRLGWLHDAGGDRYQPNFERAVDDQLKTSDPESDLEGGKCPALHGEAPRKNGENPAPYKDSSTVTTILSNSAIANADRSERDCNRIEASLSFSEIWQATGKSGKEGPARAAWGKLTDGERRELSELIDKHQRINLADVWLSVWLNTKAWCDYKPGPSQTVALAPLPTAPDIQTREAWLAIRDDLIRDRGADAERYLRDAVLHARVGIMIILTVPGSFVKERLDSSYREALSQEFSSRLGGEIAVAIRLREPTNDDR